MSVTDTKSMTLKKSASPSAQPMQTGASHDAYRILAVVDGSERSNRLVAFLKALAARSMPIEVIVLNVQSLRRDHRLRGYQSFKRAEIEDRLINEIGMPIVASVARQLEKLGICAQSRVEIGEPDEWIPRCAAEEGCDAVLVGERKAGFLRRFFARTFGLVSGAAANLVVLSEAPLIVVK